MRARQAAAPIATVSARLPLEARCAYHKQRHKIDGEWTLRD